MKTSLLRRDPIAIRLIIGSSRSAVMPWTYWGVTAVSSMTTPAALAVARPVAAPMSSTDAAASRARAATSSSSPNRPALIASPSWHRRLPGGATSPHRACGRRPAAHKEHQHVFGEAVLHRIHPQALRHRPFRPGPAPAPDGEIATDIGLRQQIENLTGVIGFEVGDQHPHVGPHTVVPAAGRQPIRDPA